MAITEEIEDPDGLLMPEDEGEGEDEDKDDCIDELAELSEDKQTRLLENTAVVCQAVTKVRINDHCRVARVHRGCR